MVKPTKLTDVTLTSKDLLPEKEYDVKKIGIVSRVIGKPIGIRYLKGMNYAEQTEHGFRITKANPKVVGISGNVAINHELAHLLFNSFDARTFKTIKLWSEAWKKTEKDTISVQIAEKIYLEAYNIIEDQRIESLWGRIYLGVKNDFIKTRRALGKKLHELKRGLIEDTPSAVLLSERFFRTDIVESSKYKDLAKYVHDVEGKERQASIIILYKIKPYLDEVIKKCMSEQSKVEKCQQEYNELTNAKPSYERTTDEKVEISNKSLEKVKHNSKLNRLMKADKGNKMQDNRKIRNEYLKNDVDFSRSYSKEELHSDDYEEELERLEEDGKNTVEDIKSKLSSENASKVQTTRTKIEAISKRKQKIPIEINSRWVSHMKGMFRAFKEKEKETVSSDGYDLDIEEYINMKSRGHGECFTDTSKSYGLSVVLSIDGSGSMRGRNDEVVKKICATIYKAIDGVDNIDLKCITWTSNVHGDIRLRKYNNMNDLEYLDQQTHGYTPTHVGFRVGSELLSTMKGKRKLLILLTDGYPCYYQNGKKMSINTVIRETIKQFKIASRKTPNILVVGVGYGDMLGNILKNKFISCNSMREVETLLMNKMKKEIIRVMRK
tara:strand:+ start:2164 stop:3984 length:1821 start_codon:yes stop_codon:yes gene_type:complete